MHGTTTNHWIDHSEESVLELKLANAKAVCGRIISRKNQYLFLVNKRPQMELQYLLTIICFQKTEMETASKYNSSERKTWTPYLSKNFDLYTPLEKNRKLYNKVTPVEHEEETNEKLTHYD